MKTNTFLTFGHAGVLAVLLSLSAAHAQEKAAAVPGATGVKQDVVDRVAGVKQDAIEKVKPVTQTPPPPPQAVPPPPPTSVEVKPVTQTPPPPPPPTAVEIKPVTQAPPPPVSAVHQAATIQAVNGVTGINTAKLKNLEAALILKQAAEAPKGDDAEHSGKGKAAAAALLAAPLDKPAPKPPKEDGRAGFHEFEKLQNRGS
jgi:hypothetical protein